MPSQSPLATPSAKAHERVTGRWNRNIQVSGPRDRFFYYLKHIVGTPAMWLLPVFVFSVFTSRAVLEISSWSFALFTLLYIVADRFSKTKEFSPFPFGSDFALIGFFITGLIGTIVLVPLPDTLVGIAALRWVVLGYLFIFGLDLFPGVNRLYFFMIGGATVLSVTGIFQHFSGVNYIQGGNLELAPIKEHAYFEAIGFFNSPRVLPTLLAMSIPFPAAAFLFTEKRTPLILRWSLLPLLCLFALALMWTYQPGMWVAAAAGVVTLAILQFRRQLPMFAAVGAFVFAVILIAYDSPQGFIDQIETNQEKVAATQREELSRQLNAFSEAPIFGNGMGSQLTEQFNRDYGSVYFQLLAETGVVGLTFFFIFVLGSLLAAYRLLREIPSSYFWHRTLVAGTMGSQIAFHAAGLHWPTLREPHVLYLFIFELAVIAYVTEEYRRGLVSDDYAL